MDELRRGVWREATRDAIKAFFGKHPDLDLPLTIDCLDMNESTPIGESGQLRTRLFRLGIRADEYGNPAWDENYPESFNGGVVKFITSVGDNVCEELDIDMTFPPETRGSDEKALTTTSSMVEGESAATA
jgi:hypothetical protein